MSDDNRILEALHIKRCCQNGPHTLLGIVRRQCGEELSNEEALERLLQEHHIDVRLIRRHALISKKLHLLILFEDCQVM